MRFAGIDVAAERHVAAMVDETGRVLCKPGGFGEDAAGYAHLSQLLGGPKDCLVALEATGHYWRNLFVSLVAIGVCGCGAQSLADPPVRGRRTRTNQD
jgi:transposase